MKRLTIVAILLFTILAVDAQNSFQLIGNNINTKLYYNGKQQVVNTAIDMLIDDSKLVSSSPFSRTNSIDANTVIIGIPQVESDFTSLLNKNKIDYSQITGRWEAFKILTATIDNSQCLVIIGSDPRGAAYGILELSRAIGVTPWVWWADAIPSKKDNLFYTSDNKVHAPSVQYRGIFLNDEDWALMPWSTRTFEPTPIKGAIGPETYKRIFQLLLRLRANTIWPAMHECTKPFFMVEGNKEVADKYGIVLSTSHAEPMMRTNTGEWDNTKYGAFNFIDNKEQVLKYWEERVKQLTKSENIYTIGMRGIHDGRMQGVSSLDDETAILHKVIDEQRNILARNNPDKKINTIPQIFVPYKEVLKAYDNGLKLPDDVTLVWCDDNHGHIMRLSNPEEQKRSGGAGVYYHVSYWGKPHDYLWLGSTQPALIYTEMKRAWDNNARRLWILNVGDIKPNEYLTEFFLDMAWDINSFSSNNIYGHQREWLQKIFGNNSIDRIQQIMKTYYHLSGERKPEHMGWNQVEVWSIKSGRQPVNDSELSPTAFGDEMERRIKAYDKIATQSTEVYENSIPQELKPAYFQLIHYPVLASSAMNRKILYAQKSRLYANKDIELSSYYARLSMQAYNEIATLDYIYNKDMLNGKWELMMDMKPRDLPVFQQPVLPSLPTDIFNDANKSIKPNIPTTPVLVKTAGTPMEGDSMIALNAYKYVNNIKLETIEGLGHSDNAVRLPVAGKINTKEPHLEYKVNTTSHGDVKIKIGTIPMHPLYGKSELRCAIVIDNQKPLFISTAASFLSEQWTKNVLRNQTLSVINASIPEPGEHIIRIYAIDEELFVDQLMLDFNMNREHYLIPAVNY